MMMVTIHSPLSCCAQTNPCDDGYKQMDSPFDFCLVQLAGRYLRVAEQLKMDDMASALSDLLEDFDRDDPVG